MAKKKKKPRYKPERLELPVATERKMLEMTVLAVARSLGIEMDSNREFKPDEKIKIINKMSELQNNPDELKKIYGSFFGEELNKLIEKELNSNGFDNKSLLPFFKSEQ